MAEILKEWLTERLNQPIKWEPQEFGELMKNGQIVASVLLSYHVINEEKHFLIRGTLLPVDIHNNWMYIAQWLHDLDIYLSDSDLVNIKEGKGSVLLRLFYQLFLTLDKRDRTDFIKRERKMVSNLVEKLTNKFKVDKVDENEEYMVDHLSRPLLNERHFIEWQRKKTMEVKDTYDFIKFRYKKILEKIEETKIDSQYKGPKVKRTTSKDARDMETFALRYPCKFQNYTYEELLKMEESSTERKQSMSDTEWAKKYMENLYTRMHKTSDSEEFQKQVRNVLSNSLWDLSVGEEESQLDVDLGRKVMKFSQFEKQMCTQIMETKQQARNLIKNRIDAEQEFAAQRDQQFSQYLDNLKEQIHLEVAETDFEKHRQEMLHQKLYAEKMRRKRLHYYEICYETMLALVDYATRYAYFTRLIESDIPAHYIHEWKTLFFRKQPIFDILEPMEDLIKQYPLEEEPEPEFEEIMRLELDRQDALNDSEFIEYHNYSYPWTLDLLIPNYDPESEDRKYEYLGTRILGHLVYTLLEIKYPYPPPRPPADLPNFSSKGIIRGLPDKAITLAMQSLLNLSKVQVVRIESAINYCLRTFKNEMIGIADIDVNYDKFITAAIEEDSREFLRSLKEEEVSKSSDLTVILLPPNTKQTQTPKTLPEEEVIFSTAADLGKYAYEALSFGDSLTDHLLAAMLVQYIKSLKNINGFVIINYPNSYREAAILEETFSGREPPPEEDLGDRDDIYLEETIAKHRKKEKDPYIDVRLSRLVNDPHKKKIEIPFQSYFTCYIKLKETEDILQEYVIWDLTEDNSELIDRFYATLGINYSMYFEVIEKDLLAQICKYIIGDLSTPLKSCESLFGENVLSNLFFPPADDKRTKSRIIKPEVSSIKSKEKLRHNRSKQSRSQDLKIVKPPESHEEFQDDHIAVSEGVIVEEEHYDKSEYSVEEINILAGEEDWDYGELPIIEKIGIALATCWEQIEKTYIHDLELLFYSKRLQMNCLIPYTRFIKDKMEQIITLPSFKQDLVFQFQKEYNDFEDDWRDVNLTKNEWHCRIKELQLRLYNICDERKIHAEQQKQALIMDNWAVEELTTMANTYISCMQTELNRSILTYQALHDFYYAMIKKLPANDRLVSKDLTKINRESDETSGSRKGGEDKVFRQLKNNYQDLLLKNIQLDYSNNPFNMILENNVKFAIKFIKDTNDHYRSVISREYNEIAKMVPTVKKKDELKESSQDTINQEEIFKQNALKCIEEWIMGINGEMYRANLRMIALQYKCYHDMKLFSDHIFKTFMEIQNDINEYYMNETVSVDRLCKYFQMAVENGRKIPETLILEHDTFTIDPNLLQVSPPEPALDTGEITELPNDLEFKICQLARLRTEFKIVAPTGLALLQAFIYLVQDFVFFGKESCEGPLVPECWKRVDPDQIPKLIYLLFGETAYVDWRDFLIYCLNIRFPTVEELLDLRHKLRCKDSDSTECIGRDDFLKEELWFEKDFDYNDPYAQLRRALIKHFIFELYETSEDVMNYSAFLLAFCKHMDPIQGFTSALSMAIGKKTCYSLEECEEVVCKMIKLKQYKDECLACAHLCTNKFLDTLIANVVDYCEGTTVMDVPNTDIDLNKDKGKAGKGKSVKTRKSETGRLGKGKGSSILSKNISSRSVVAHSTPEVNKTYICKPCEEEPQKEKPTEKEEIEEEYKSEVIEDPNLAYAVSQDVIWNVLRICLPWHFELFPEEKMTPYVDLVQEVMKRLEVNHEKGDMYVSMFVADPNICKFLHKIRKFTALSMIDEVRKVCV